MRKVDYTASNRPPRPDGWTRTPRTLAVATLLALAPESGLAQEVMEIDDRIACPGCAIETGPPVTLAPPRASVHFTSLPPPLVARDGEGNYIVTRVSGDAFVAVFGPDGRFRSSYGRRGEGPDEFVSVPRTMAIGADDVLHVVDPLNLYTLAPQAARQLDRVRLPVLASAAVALRDGIALQAPVRTEAGITTVQILRPDGTIRASIGVAETGGGRSRSVPTWDDPDLRRALGRSNDHADVWVAPIYRYQVVRYGPDGEETARIERVSDWFPPNAANQWGLGGIHQDAEGLLWVTIGWDDPSYSPVTDARQPGDEGSPVSPFLDLNQVLNVTVEVLDPVAGELVARREFDEVVTFVSTAGDDVFIYSLHPDPLGDLDCVIRRLTVRRG